MVKVYGIPFLGTILRIIKIVKATKLLNTQVPVIVTALLVIMHTYRARGFRILTIIVDYVFEAIKESADFMEVGIVLNKSYTDEHIPFIGRFD